MRNIINNRYEKVFFTTLVALFMSACGSSDGTAHNKTIGTCENNSTDAILAKAIVVPANSTIIKDSDDTLLRVWHFQNSEELICVVKGSASIVSAP